MVANQEILENVEIEQEERELRREYFVFVPLLIAIFIIISLALPENQARRVVELIPGASNSYWLAYSTGEVESYGSAEKVQSKASDNQSIVTGGSNGQSLWTISQRGDVNPFAGASYEGGVNAVYDRLQIVDMIVQPNGRSYRLVTIDGEVFDFNTSAVSGITSLKELLGDDNDQEVVAGLATTSGEGYWLVSKAGNIYSFGDAEPQSNLSLNEGEFIVSADSDGENLVILTNGGQVINVGSLEHYGDLSGQDNFSPLIDIDLTSTAKGYWILDQDSKVSGFGDANQLKLVD